MHTKKQLESMSEAKLAELAAELTLDVDTGVTPKKDVIAAILEAEELDARPLEPESETAPEPEPEPEPAPKPKRTVSATRRRKYRIVMHEQDGINNTKFVKVGVNGKLYSIPREVEVVIDDDVKHVLDNAVERHFDRHQNKSGEVEYTERLVRRFSYTLVGIE